MSRETRDGAAWIMGATSWVYATAVISSGWLFESAGAGAAAVAGCSGGRRRGGNDGAARSVIVILLSGGLGQHDSFDMKPEAPGGIRGEFKPIETSVAGIRMCEHLPGWRHERASWRSCARCLIRKVITSRPYIVY